MSKRDVSIISFDTYDIGPVATIHFLDGKPPAIGDTVEYEGAIYMVSGIVMTSNSTLLYENQVKGIYDCKLLKKADAQ